MNNAYLANVAEGAYHHAVMRLLSSLSFYKSPVKVMEEHQLLDYIDKSAVYLQVCGEAFLKAFGVECDKLISDAYDRMAISPEARNVALGFVSHARDHALTLMRISPDATLSEHHEVVQSREMLIDLYDEVIRFNS